ncbi:hypothetical protein, partial [Aminobacterium colombiense]|uniref:hypothetical protein n=1 Tax=Aminobacterium colombiense TaxID=81468 RepID=UPI002592D6D5
APRSLISVANIPSTRECKRLAVVSYLLLKGHKYGGSDDFPTLFLTNLPLTAVLSGSLCRPRS